jgi:ABC-type Na+ transport system ATPase subunit NatA
VLTELETLADDVAFLCDGTLRFAGSVAELLAHTGEERLEPAIASLMLSERSRFAAAIAAGPAPRLGRAFAPEAV